MPARGDGQPSRPNRSHYVRYGSAGRRLGDGSDNTPDHVHGRGMHPGKPGDLHDDPASSGHPVDHSVPSRSPAARERLDCRPKRPEPAEKGIVRIPPQPCPIIAHGPRYVREWLPQLAAEDGFVDRLFQARVWRLVPPGLGMELVGARHRQESSGAADLGIGPRRSQRVKNIIVYTSIVTIVKVQIAALNLNGLSRTYYLSYT
jgi:hypothetical protein